MKKEQIKQLLINNQFLVATKYRHNNDFNLKYNATAVEQLLSHFNDYLDNHSEIEFRDYLIHFDIKKYFNDFNDNIGCKSCYILITHNQFLHLYSFKSNLRYAIA